jgi:geranylgeranyl diphosphate synthase type II
MYSINELISIINDEIKDNFKDREPIHLYEPIEYSMSVGGKRIRPVLCLMACNMFSSNIKPAIKPAIGIETFHNFTLLHDDIMDKADLRRNKPTVHKKWDENTAILSGDAMMIEAYQYFLNLEPNLLAKSLKVFNPTALEVCEGQQYDMDFESRNDVKENEYIEMIRLKTAVLIAGALKIGAIIGGANDNDADKIYEFGINMGLAFQLQDDYLDTFGNEATFGKRIGGDIAENKKTFLLINALEKSPKQLSALIENKNISESEKIEKVTQIYKDLNIDKLSKDKVIEYYQKALNSINEIQIEENKKKQLLSFLNKLEERIY